MKIFKRCWNRLRHLNRSLRSFLLLSAATIAALAFLLLIYSRFTEQSPCKCHLEKEAILLFSLPGTQSLSSLLLPFLPFSTPENISYQEVESEGTKWKAAALKTDSVGVLLAEMSEELIRKKLMPLISVVLDSSGAEYLLMIGKEGQISLSSMKFLIEHFLVDFKGRSAIEIRIPSEWGSSGDHIPFHLIPNMAQVFEPK